MPASTAAGRHRRSPSARRRHRRGRRIGNHEIYALSVRDGTWPRKDDTLQALFDADDGDDLLAQLRDLPALVKLPAMGAPIGDVFVVHAGVHPKWELDAMLAPLGAGEHGRDWLDSDAVKFATRVRCCTADGERSRHHGKPEDCPPPYRPWDEHYSGMTMIVHGHWAWRGYYRRQRVIGLDSGCVYGGPLTAWCIEEDRVVQVPARARDRA